jgi:hypothetical protein
VNGDDDLTVRLREICMALPEVTERPSHGHHDDDFPHLWCAGLPGRVRVSGGQTVASY